MATYVAPTVTNNCIGTAVDGTALTWFKCKRPTNTKECVNMRKFYAKCADTNQLCNSLSNAYVASVILCRQNIS